MVKLDYIHNRTARWEHYNEMIGKSFNGKYNEADAPDFKSEQDTAEFGTLDEGIKLD